MIGMCKYVCKLAFLAVVVFASTTYASEPDVVVLSSGNRLTGSISELTRGELSFSIEGAGSVDINWHNVDSLQSEKTLDVELRSGERFTGPISSPSKGKLEVKTSIGTKTVDMKDVVRIKPLAATFVERTSGDIEVGFGVYQAQSELDLTLEAGAENRTRNYLTTISFDSLVRRQDGVNSLSRNHFEIGSRRFLPKRWFVLGQFDVQQDEALDLDLRILAAGSLGRMLVHNNRNTLSAYGGFDYNGEAYGGFSNQNSPEGLAALEWDWFDVNSKTELKADARSYFSLTQSRIRFELKTEIRHDLYRKYFAAINFFDDFDSNPPAGQKGTDYGLTITIGRSF
jgi:hypothetical protein